MNEKIPQGKLPKYKYPFVVGFLWFLAATSAAIILWGMIEAKVTGNWREGIVSYLAVFPLSVLGVGLIGVAISRLTRPKNWRDQLAAKRAAEANSETNEG